jgi:hypothetical protein
MSENLDCAYGVSVESQQPHRNLPPATAEQLRRAMSLLDLAEATADLDMKFTLCVSALHLARAIPEHWYTVAENIPIELGKQGKERDEQAQQLRQEFEEIFKTARRYQLLSNLRQWDFHWEPVRNPLTIAPNCNYGRGAPMRLSTGPNKNSSVAYIGGKVVTTGSGHRVGRSNYYQIQQNRFVDSQANEALPLGLAVRQFLEDVPNCISAIMQKPEVIADIKARE